MPSIRTPMTTSRATAEVRTCVLRLQYTWWERRRDGETKDHRGELWRNEGGELAASGARLCATVEGVPHGDRLVTVVEDEPTIREAVCFALRREGYRTEAFDDGVNAWQAFEQALPDLAILDIGLPRLDGLE